MSIMKVESLRFKVSSYEILPNFNGEAVAEGELQTQKKSLIEAQFFFLIQNIFLLLALTINDFFSFKKFANAIIKAFEYAKTCGYSN